MTDDLDRFVGVILSAALRDDQEALCKHVQSLIVTIRQLRSENAQAWEQAGSDRADLNMALVELDQARREQQSIVQAAEQGIAALNDALAHVGTELAAARDLIDLFRAHFHAGGEVPGSFPRRLDAYDAVKKS